MVKVMCAMDIDKLSNKHTHTHTHAHAHTHKHTHTHTHKNTHTYIRALGQRPISVYSIDSLISDTINN